MARGLIWKSITDTLRAEIAAGHYQPGDKLPTESQLAARFGVNRHTVRHALAALADEGLVHARRGAGVFVTIRPTDYPIGRRVRFHQNVVASGRAASRRFTLLETRAAGPDEAEALELALGTPVHVIEGVSLADVAPLAMFRSVFPAAALDGFLDQLRRTSSVTAALAACGISDYTRAQTRITAKLAKPVQALTLQLPEGAPILRSVAINRDPAGRPIEFGTTWFAGERVTLTVSPES